MIYRQRDTRRKKKRIIILTGIMSGVLVATSILSYAAPNLLTPLSHTLGKPLFAVRSGFVSRTAASFNYFRFKKTLIEENRSLKESSKLLAAVEIERNFYKHENAELEKLVGKREISSRHSAARILSKPGFSPYDTLIINSGREEGVRAGERVLADEDTALGVISEVYAHTAIATLFSSPGKEIPVLVGSKSVQALALGKGAGNADIKFPRNTNIAVGDIVVIASSSPKILGTIEYITDNPADSFVRALFRSSVDTGNISYVLIEKQ